MDDLAFDIAPLTLPARLYRDPEAYQRERTGVFGRTWQFLGHEDELAAPGDYLATDLAGFPVVAVRGGDGELRAFHNVCRHRAGPLVADGGGNCGKELVCRYHGWRYLLDGRLRAATGFGPAPGFDPREYGLHEIGVQAWRRGLVFVNLDRSAAPLAKLLEPLDRLWAERGREIPPLTLRLSHEIVCDWKTYVENYLEGYHVGAVHPALAAEVDAARYDVRMEGAVAIHEAPPLDPNKITEGLWAWVWPNLGVNVYRGGLMLERMNPAGFGRTRLDYVYFHDPASGDLADYRAVSDQTTLEDIAICEAVQRNLSAGVYDTGVLSLRHEIGVGWFQREIRKVHGL